MIEYAVAITECKLSGPFVGVCSVAFAVASVVYLLGCCCSAVPYKLHYAETLTLLTLTLLTLTAPRSAKPTDKTSRVAAQSR
jgi:hypothetical protein